MYIHIHHMCIYIYLHVCVSYVYTYIYMYNLVCTYQTTNNFKQKKNPNIRRSSWGESPHRSARGLHSLYGAHLAQRHGEFGRRSPGQTHASWAHGLVGEAVGHTFFFSRVVEKRVIVELTNKYNNMNMSIYVNNFMNICMWVFKKNERGVFSVLKDHEASNVANAVP